MTTLRNCNGNKATFYQLSVHLKELFLMSLCCSYPCTDVTILCTNLTNKLMMLMPHYSYCDTPTCFSPQGAIHREYWYFSQQNTCPDVNARLKSSMLQLPHNIQHAGTPRRWFLVSWNMQECNSVNKVVITCLALVGFWHKIFVTNFSVAYADILQH